MTDEKIDHVRRKLLKLAFYLPPAMLVLTPRSGGADGGEPRRAFPAVRPEVAVPLITRPEVFQQVRVTVRPAVLEQVQVLVRLRPRVRVTIPIRLRPEVRGSLRIRLRIQPIVRPRADGVWR